MKRPMLSWRGCLVDKIDAMMARRYFEPVSSWRRRMAVIVAEAAKRLYPSCVYVFGGVAEGRLTAASDVDILVVLSRDLDPARGLEQS